MLYRSRYNGVPIYATIDGMEYEHMMGMGDPVMWTGKVGTYVVLEPEVYYEVYAPVQGPSGWVYEGNIEPLEDSKKVHG